LCYHESFVTTGIDSLERLQIHVDIERQAVKGSPLPHTQANGGDFLAINIDTRRPFSPLTVDAVMVQYQDNGFFDAVDEFTHAHATAANVHQGISDDLAGAVIGYLPTPVDLDNRDITGGQYMLGLAGLALGEYRRMLDQPEFISGVFIPLVGELLHGMPDRLVIGKPELSDEKAFAGCIAVCVVHRNYWYIQSAISTCSQSVNSR
jgi:hypothetical protein